MTSPDGHDPSPSSDRPAVAYDAPRALLDAIAARVRYSLDLDLLYTGELNAAVDALREAAGRDLADHFRFDIGSARGTLIGVRGRDFSGATRSHTRERLSIDPTPAVTRATTTASLIDTGCLYHAYRLNSRAYAIGAPGTCIAQRT